MSYIIVITKPIDLYLPCHALVFREGLHLTDRSYLGIEIDIGGPGL